ncbi:MAG: tRNA (adenosine(37)-N6)-threonylcarbamoyltransferase complex ATPase subunit type 1 TsaE [Treponema sp.]|jgi:tRNA threonylcarbamoyladenosine biosynthesis protein TsaE|nr:tRNA (adenosine(37)-N6)-threonylcarbamoyltransferase complex ATPase subunit type 1 TsaE [Treponema sp.]
MTWIPREASPIEFSSASPEETEALGERLALKLGPGSVLALRGPLGAGKTCFAKGLARGLGVEEEVTSPTYTIVSEYEAQLKDPLPFYHIDAYRLNGEDDFEALGGRELLYGGGICLIEWSERIETALPPRTIRVEIEITGGNSRIIRVLGELP